jgi:hypothetical protein
MHDATNEMTYSETLTLAAPAKTILTAVLWETTCQL